MFAFAIWDSSKKTLFLARDHFGIKPLYYIVRGSQLAFASEAKAFTVLPDHCLEVDTSSLDQYMTFLWVPEPRTIYTDISKLPAGHFAEWKDGRLSLEKYWEPTWPQKNYLYPISSDEMVEGVRHHFKRAVKEQLLSDVPLGAFLSAGLDSSSIVAVMSEVSSHPPFTYTIGFEQKYSRGEMTLDDIEVAKRTAAHFGCRQTTIIVDPEVTELLPKLIYHMDEPVADPALITAYLVCAEAKKEVTVLLSGVGGDEVFGGYRKYYAHYWARLYRFMPKWWRRTVFEPAILSLPSLEASQFKGIMRLAKKMARSASLSDRDAFVMNSVYCDESLKNQLYQPWLKNDLAQSDSLHHHMALFDEVRDVDFLNQMLHLDTKAFMPSLNLAYNDKMSMASSVEIRVPFLDKDLFEFVAWNVPPSMKISGRLKPETKYVLRKAMASCLPREVLRQKKAGFGAPISRWLRVDLRDMVNDILSPACIRSRGFFEPRGVQDLLDSFYAGRYDWSYQIWQLLTFELWARQFIDR